MVGSSSVKLWLRVALALVVSSLAPLTPARAHEVQPVVLDMEIGAESVDIQAVWMIETAVAGLDLADLADTSDAENDGEYDRLRAMEPEALEQAVRNAWPGIAAQLDLTSGEERLPLRLTGIEVMPVGNVEVARLSTLTLTAPLPPGEAPLVFRAEPSLGPFVLRQTGIEGGYAAFLTPGTASDPIPRTGGDDSTAWEAFVDYIFVGFDHIVPKGLDHILFVLGLFFLSTRMGPLLWQVSAFTLAHTVTLALGALDIVRIPGSIVEPLIAASIVYVGIENLIFRNLTPWRPFVVFGFGLLHGLGFASVLQDFGLGASNFVPKLLGFNIGVEIGQLAVIAVAWLTLNLFFARYEWYHRRIAAPVSVAIAAIATFWVLERTGVVSADGPWAIFSALTEGGFDPYWVTGIALVAVLILTGLEMLTITEDMFREISTVLTSAILFLAIVATFTSGAWIMVAILAAAWVLSLRLQSLGEPPELAA